MHKGLRKLFYNLSIASKKIEERNFKREVLHSQLTKIQRASINKPIAKDLKKLEEQIVDLLEKKINLSKQHEPEQKVILEKLKKKEKELDEKIEKMNELLAKVGKKVDENEFKDYLMNKKKRQINELEDKLYSLEQTYFKLRDDESVPAEKIVAVKERISALKEKIKEIKEKETI